MKFDFVNINDCHRYFNSVVVMYDGYPHYTKVRADGRNDPNTIQIRKLAHLDDKFFNVNVKTDAKLSTDVPELGYMNCQKEAFLMSRVPGRWQRASICTDNVVSIQGGEVAEDLYQFIDTPNFLAVLTNKYPSFNEALELVNSGAMNSCAFHKNYRVKKFGKVVLGIEFKNDMCCWKALGNAKWMVAPDRRDFSFLKDKLNKLGVNVE